MATGGDFWGELARKTPEIALGIIAARQGPQALAGFQGGVRESQARSHDLATQQQALERQAQLDEERRQQQATQEARAQREEQRGIEAEERGRVQSAMTAYDRYIASIGETATDPVAAENQILARGVGLENALGLKPGQLSPFVPDMGPVITNREKRAAQEFVEALPKNKLYEGYFQSPEGLAELDNITVAWRGGQKKVGELRAIAGMTIPPKIATPRPDLPDTTEESHIADALAIAEEQKGAPLTRTERAQVRLKAVEEFGRIRIAGSGPSASEQRTVLRDRQADLRAQLRDALEFPNEQKPGTLKRLATEFAKSQLEFERESRAVTQQIERDRLADTRRRQLTGDPLDAFLDSAEPDALSTVPGGRSVGAGPVGGRGAAVGPAGRSGTPITVQTPDGQVFTFPTQQAADSFKRAAGIR